MPLSELNGSIVPIYVDKCRPAESRTWIVVLLCNKSTFQGHVPYVMNNSGIFIYTGEHLCYYICVNVYFESKAVSVYVQEQ